MNFEPQKFFIGLIDFFSTLLPGAVLAYLTKDWAGPLLLGNAYTCLQGADAWILFLFASYLLGHFLFLLGSWLDDLAYDPLRKMTDEGQITRLLNAGQPSSRFSRFFARLCFKRDADAALTRIIPVKESALRRVDAPSAVNAFQWSKATLALKYPEALATVNRFEADSKFFRSFIPVLLGLLGVTIYRIAVPPGWSDRSSQWSLMVIWLLFLGLAFWRYMEQRFKATQQAYWTLLTLVADTQSPSEAWPQSPPQKQPNRPTHAGGVVFKRRGQNVEYLLVQAKKEPRVWVLPKGHIESGEDDRRTAIREVKEETGTWARIIKELKVIEYQVAGETVSVHYYLMEALESGKPRDRYRKHHWLTLDRAIANVAHRESKKLLALADENLRAAKPRDHESREGYES